ncbi:hypothetical protein C2857_006625 [Epichloe festucae Fl1]|uniref:Uncharacterized protein n=1 Tax=Epichloe festucae (strain Fl1) TaxID=877507 RepID=A0A7S9KTM1_EPIFF|nr:hypothetical protein C2857_006625 [Epichloe festucae Fl1]
MRHFSYRKLFNSVFTSKCCILLRCDAITCVTFIMDRTQQTAFNLWGTCNFTSMHSYISGKGPNKIDNHNRLVADILTRYRTLMMHATVQAEGEHNNATPETMAVTGISMRMEFEGLNSSIKELLTLSRKVKELWVFGPLGQGNPEKKAKEAQIDEDVAQVAALLNGLEGRRMAALAERCGGSWEVLS